MHVALIGVSGRVGSRLLAEMLARGHEVTGIARNVKDVSPRAHLTLESADANQPTQLAPLLRGHDVAASAMKFVPTDARALIAAVKQASVQRLMVVGGAGTLEVAEGVQLMDTPDFSWISMEDYAIAFVDELETPKHRRERFTVGY